MTALTGRVALITGASSGIGAATARLPAARGAKVALLARRKERLDELVAQITAAGGTALGRPVDVTDAQAIGSAVAEVNAAFGPVDLVVSNAGIMLPAPVEELRADQWQHQIDLNITAVMHTIGAVVPQLVAAAGAGGPADLVTISSIAAQNLYPNFAVYSATKAYITHLSRHLRAELGPKDVAEVVAFTAGLPRHVNLQQVTVMPTRQAS